MVQYSKRRLCFLPVFFILLYAIPRETMGQKQLVNKLMHQFFSTEKDTTRSSSFMPLPILGYAQETGWEAGVMGLYSFYTSKADSSIRNSSIGASVSYTQKKQTALKLVSDIWTKNNDFHYYTEIRYRNFPFFYYGLGANTQYDNRDLLNEKRFYIQTSVDKRIKGSYYAGLRAGFSNYHYRDEVKDGIFNMDPPYGENGGKYMYIGMEHIVDTRNNNTYTNRGQFAKISVDFVPGVFGNNNYKGAVITGDYRFFHSFQSKLVLGVNGVYRTTTSSQTPFYLLSQLGNDAMMRGYYQGRYRDRNMAALQTELRYRFMPRFGAVVFAGTGTVYGMDKFNLNNSLKPNYGAGIRYFFDLQRSLSVRIDYGIGQKQGNEKRQSGWYFSLGEAF